MLSAYKLSRAVHATRSAWSSSEQWITYSKVKNGPELTDANRPVSLEL